MSIDTEIMFIISSGKSSTIIIKATELSTIKTDDFWCARKNTFEKVFSHARNVANIPLPFILPAHVTLLSVIFKSVSVFGLEPKCPHLPPKRKGTFLECLMADKTGLVSTLRIVMKYVVQLISSQFKNSSAHVMKNFGVDEPEDKFHYSELVQIGC